MNLPLAAEPRPAALLFADLERRFFSEPALVNVPADTKDGIEGVMVSTLLRIEDEEFWSGIGLTIGSLTLHIGKSGDMYSVEEGGVRSQLQEEVSTVICGLVRKVVNLRAE